MGAAMAVCTTREGEAPERHPDSSPRPAHKLSGSSDIRGPGSLAEPDAEPDEHEDFVRGLRIQLEKEEEPEMWMMSDLTEQAAGPRGVAIRTAIEELKRYFEEWNNAGHDAFWHRKSHQVVLAVVVCRGEDGSLSCYRGMNTEVSLPAGSLCAERAAIARAASDLRRSADIVAVAVLDPRDCINPLWPCEVCQSWLAKLKDQSAAICVVAVSSATCEEFLVRVNGVLQPRPREPVQPPPAQLADRIRLAEGVREQPWEARSLVYVDGAWDQVGTEHFALLRSAQSKGSHLLVGIYSDETLKRELGSAAREPLDTRTARVLEDRHVSSVLVDAPWSLTDEFIARLGIRRVVTESKTPERRKKWCTEAYEAARKRGIVETVSVQ